MKEGVQSDDVQSYKIDIKEGVCKIGSLEGVQKVLSIYDMSARARNSKIHLKKTQKSLQI